MYDINIYTGKPIKSITKEGIFEIIKIDYLIEEVICTPINSIDNKRETFKFKDLKDL